MANKRFQDTILESGKRILHLPYSIHEKCAWGKRHGTICTIFCFPFFHFVNMQCDVLSQVSKKVRIMRAKTSIIHHSNICAYELHVTTILVEHYFILCSDKFLVAQILLYKGLYSDLCRSIPLCYPMYSTGLTS